MVLLGGLLVAAVTDARSGRIPNVLTFPMMAVGIAFWAATGPDRWFGLAGCAAAFAIHYVLYALQVEKAGDAKLMMAIGALAGWRTMVEATFWWAILFVPIGLLVLTVRGRLPNLVASARYTLRKMQGPVEGPGPEQTPLRVGPVLMVAGVLAWATDWLGQYI